MTRKELFYSLFSKHDRIRFTFTHDELNLEDFIQSGLGNDAANDNGGNEIIIEPRTEEFDTTALREIMVSLEKQVFSANKTLAAHTFDRSTRNDYNFRFTIDDASMELNYLTASCFHRSKWAKFYYDYDEYDSKNKWKTLYIAYELSFFLDSDFNLESAQITFVDLNEVTYSVYPDNEIDVEDMKSKIDDMYEIKKISETSKTRWGLY